MTKITEARLIPQKLATQQYKKVMHTYTLITSHFNLDKYLLGQHTVN